MSSKPICIYSSVTLASTGDVRVALIVLRAVADIAVGHVGTTAVAADACIVRRWLLTFHRTLGVSNGEIDHIGHTPRELVNGVAVQVCRGEVVP